MPEIMEMPLQSWKGGDVTDEDFIPQHRIAWFRRDEDGVKVWDRSERLDLIFGSGLQTLKDKQATVDTPQVTNDLIRLPLATVHHDKLEPVDDGVAQGLRG